MALNEQQVSHGLARFLEAYPALQREVEKMDETVARHLCIELDELRRQHGLELMAKMAKSLGMDNFTFMLEFAVDTPEERTRHLAEREEAEKRALGL
ncbi:hypothetical protein B0T49_13585 [Chromobacterium violaceum]|uniref:DUF6388 family protein n=1 Tax=Chromobacterium violaceum TaxID=536 RepID=UPI0009D9B2B1|nr:DUF6388 family protein [Chromobacterium violaceum]OQS21169.1 hypothetical protein B0T41_21130 [Chromobacterium violaceum]OQS46715.1 hypothetical protein B0T48_14795 [Chromobacterium violaceum]OQS49361.1 hypothetical protein B0T49_13585 [Chromobacterium violaceum]